MVFFCIVVALITDTDFPLSEIEELEGGGGKATVPPGEERRQEKEGKVV